MAPPPCGVLRLKRCQRHTDPFSFDLCAAHGGPGASSRDCFQMVAHDRARRHSASDYPEPGARESRCVPGGRRARCQLSIQRIGFQRRCSRAPCNLQSGRDQLRGHALPTMADTHIEARERPNWQIVDALKPPGAIKPRQDATGRELAPANGDVAIECHQARRRTAPYELAKVCPVPLTRPLVIGAADPPIHAPAAIAGTALAEQILERRPQIRREREDSKLRTALRFHHAGPPTETTSLAYSADARDPITAIISGSSQDEMLSWAGQYGL